MNDKLIKNLASFIEETCSEKPLDDWLKEKYQWPNSPTTRVNLYKAYNQEIVPLLKTAEVDQKSTEAYKKTLQIKEAISSAIEDGVDPKTEKKLVSFFIKKWGKVGNNFEATLNGIVETRSGMSARDDKFFDYTNETGDIAEFNRYQLDTTKLKLLDGKELSTGAVASWSKYLAIKYPKWGHVYDARVAYSLNAIIYIYNLNDALLWPMPLGRNAKTSLLDIETLILTSQFKDRALAQHTASITSARTGVANFQSIYFLKNSEAYSEYLNVLDKVVTQLNSRDNVACKNAGEIEAFLFTVADDEIFKKVLQKSLC